MAEYFYSRFEPALANLIQARSLYGELSATAGEAITFQRLAMVETAMGEHETAHAHILEGLDLAQSASMRSHCQARLFATLGRNRYEAGDHDGLQAAATAGLAAAAAHSWCTTCSGLLYPVVILARATAGDFAAARAYIQEATVAVGTNGHPFVRGLTDQVAALVAGMTGEWAQALQGLHRSRRAFLAMSHRFEVARCDLFEAMLLLQRGNPGDRPLARRLAARSIPVFTDLGAAGMLVKATSVAEEAS